jgi:Nif-specific regulatory protein
MKQIVPDTSVQILRTISTLFEENHSELDALLSVVIDTANSLVGVRNSSLILLDEKAQRLQFYQASGKKMTSLKDIEIPIGLGIAGTVVETGEPIIANDVHKDPRWLREVSDVAEVKVKSLACFPLKTDGNILGVVQFLDKVDGSPFTDEDQEVLRRFAHMIARFFQVSRSKDRLGQEFNRLKQRFLQKHTIVGECRIIRECISQAERVADSKASILIAGESGTGKELFAHLIHERSPRRDKPLISVSCGALPASILERELFGHEKGAFTGADTRKIGLFEAADGGTLFLDEIGEMPLDMQVKLLRVLQEESFMRLGGTAPIEVDVRILSATHQDLEKGVHEGRFRQDLYYRINVITLKLPSLRERAEDVSDLAAFFLKKHSPDGRPPKKFGAGVLSHLQGYSWPGNIRQLENAIERAIVLSESDELGLNLFPFENYQAPMDVEVGITLKDATDAFRKKFIDSTLKTTGGNRTKAAKILDVQRSYLSRLTKELDIE